jgi:hypothetical protein
VGRCSQRLLLGSGFATSQPPVAADGELGSLQDSCDPCVGGHGPDQLPERDAGRGVHAVVPPTSRASRLAVLFGVDVTPVRVGVREHAPPYGAITMTLSVFSLSGRW